MYADDTQLWHTFDKNNFQTAMNVINEDLKILYKLSIKHSFKLNPHKSKVLLFGKKSDCINISDQFYIQINDQKIKTSTNAKNLGVTMDQSLRYQQHVTNCLQKAYIWH